VEVRYLHVKENNGELYQFVLREGTADDTILEWQSRDYYNNLFIYTYGGGQIYGDEWNDYKPADESSMIKIIDLLFTKELA
jgi:hypothetical protein